MLGSLQRPSPTAVPTPRSDGLGRIASYARRRPFRLGLFDACVYVRTLHPSRTRQGEAWVGFATKELLLRLLKGCFSPNQGFYCRCEGKRSSTLTRTMMIADRPCIDERRKEMIEMADTPTEHSRRKRMKACVRRGASAETLFLPLNQSPWRVNLPRLEVDCTHAVLHGWGPFEGMQYGRCTRLGFNRERDAPTRGHGFGTCDPTRGPPPRPPPSRPAHARSATPCPRRPGP